MVHRSGLVNIGANVGLSKNPCLSQRDSTRTSGMLRRMKKKCQDGMYCCV